MPKRALYDIVADVLEFVAASGEARVSYIARFANLPIDRANRILAMLVRSDLLELLEEDGRRVYRATAKGYEYLELFRRLRRLLAPALAQRGREASTP